MKVILAALAVVSGLVAPAARAVEPPAEVRADEVQTGMASYYSRRFEGRHTASGATFRHDSLTAAHPSYPFGTVVLVTSLARGDSVAVRITDRGPANAHRPGRAIIDLSQSAAARLKMLQTGRTRVSVQVLEWGKGRD